MAPRSKESRPPKDEKNMDSDRKHSHGVAKNLQFFENFKKVAKSNKVKENRETEKVLEKVRSELLAVEEECIQQGISEEELKAVFAPLIRLRKRIQYERSFVFASVCFVLVSLVWYLAPLWLTWGVSAVGRVALVKILPYWDWRPLAGAKCLLGHRSTDQGSNYGDNLDNGLMETDCDVCELLVDIDRINDTTSEHLRENYFSRGAPVIVTDVDHPSNSLIESISLNDHLLDTYPCDVYTNLQLAPFGTVRELVNKFTQSTLNSTFLYMENCEKPAVKASRLLAEKPYFYSRHLPSPYLSWVLVSENYDGTWKNIHVDGLATFYQLRGSFEVKMRPKTPCDEICFELETTIRAGETMVWISMLWHFELRAIYGEKSEAFLSVTSGNP
ncbi:uncharacterized protein LOC113367519 [Ctenocephalides felis]|uniref:uncharacterized protein LOC113367519 n=1 Tax=Ctenocephalides felis TaxID=7515 RepID=UPI000E6E5BAD|nr:uncharacterized protein LOC113367519 [Ctenocephalides felis]